MTDEHEKIFAGKKAMRRKLAALPIAEKLRILDELRAREISIRAARKSRKKSSSPEQPPRSGNGDA